MDARAKFAGLAIKPFPAKHVNIIAALIYTYIHTGCAYRKLVDAFGRYNEPRVR